jgi:hypothetical protein
MFVIALMGRITLPQMSIVYSTHTVYSLATAVLPCCRAAISALPGVGPLYRRLVLLLRAVFGLSMRTASNTVVQCPGSWAGWKAQDSGGPMCACVLVEVYIVLVSCFASLYFAFRQDRAQRQGGMEKRGRGGGGAAATMLPP